MKGRFAALLLSTMLVASMMACGKEEVQPEPVVEEPVVETTEEEEPVTTEVSDEERAELFESYIDSRPKLTGKTYTISGDYSDEEGIKGIVDSDSGLLYWIYEDSYLITAEYDADNNRIMYQSFVINEAKEVEGYSQVVVNDLIEFCDDNRILFSEITPEVNKNVIMIESRSLAYTYADGVKYRLVLVDISDDGTLSVSYDDSLAGSGDEDITSMLRQGFNEATGRNYDKDTFEDAFYRDNLLIEQEGNPVHASITFKSESSKLADNDDWDGANENANRLYELATTPGEPVYWGEGKFNADSYK